MPKKSLQSILAKNTRKFRTSLGHSQERLAHSSSLHRTYIGFIERGERNVTLKTLEALAEALGITVIELLSENEADM